MKTRIAVSNKIHWPSLFKGLFELAAVFITRGTAAAGGILLSIFIGRQSGPDGLGRFTLFLSFLALFAMFARRGLDVILIKSVAGAIHTGAGGHSLAIFRHAAFTALATALVLSLPGAMLIGSNVFGTPIPDGSWTFVLCLPMLTLLALTAGYMKGVGKPWLASLFEMGGVSLAAAVFIGLAWFLGFYPSLTMSTIFFASALALGCVLGLLWVGRDASRRINTSTSSRHTQEETFIITRGQIDFTVVALSGFLIQAGSFIIAAPFLSDEALGLARAAERLSLIVSFPVLAINPFISARIVRHIHSDSVRLLWQLMGKAVFVGMVFAFPPLLAMLFAPEVLLPMLGPEFVGAAPYLRWLAVVHFVLVLLGPFSMLMNMAEGERQLMWVSGGAVLAAFGIYPFFTNAYGITGFILAYATISVARNAVIALLAVKKLTLGGISVKKPNA